MQTATTMREKQLNIRLSEDEAARLEFIENHYGLNGANVVRMLLKKEEQALRAIVERPAIGMGRARLARADLEEATGASMACPTFFRAGIAEAQRGGRAGYENAAFHLAIHARETVGWAGSQQDDLPAIRALDAALEQKDPAKAVFAWMREFLPRCYELVPAKRANAFVKGIQTAIDENRV